MTSLSLLSHKTVSLIRRFKALLVEGCFIISASSGLIRRLAIAGAGMAAPQEHSPELT